MRKYELPTSKFRKLSSDRHTDKTDKLRIVTSGHVIKMVVTPLDPPYRKPHDARKPEGSIFYRTGVMGARSLHCGNRHFGRFRLLWPWPWPDDLHIWTWLVLPGGRPDVQIWTSHVTAFESYPLTDIQTDGVQPFYITIIIGTRTLR